MIALNELANKDVEMVGKTMVGVPALPKLKTYIGTRNKLEYTGKRGIEINRIYEGTAGFTGFFALHLAICEGFNTIFLDSLIVLSSINIHNGIF